jgi:hypothetical protein
MAPPESSVDSLNNAIDPADVSRKNHLDKIDRYVQKVEAFKFSPRQADVKGLRCDIALLVLAASIKSATKQQASVKALWPTRQD